MYKTFFKNHLLNPYSTNIKLYSTSSYNNNPKNPNKNNQNIIIVLILGFYFIHLKNR
jgi:hypothetical protein